MLGYYKLKQNLIRTLPIGSKNIEDNIYDLACPLVIGKQLPQDLLYLYETLEIPIIHYNELEKFDFSKYDQFINYIETFSKYLKLNIQIEMLEEGDVGHLLRVAKYAKELAETLYLSKEEVKNIYIAALFHDVGKYLIPEEIVGKKGKLTEEEFQIMKNHSAYSFSVLKNFLNEDVLEIIRSHHERCNQSGYPDGIIPGIGAKIIGIADSYDAMISNRIYHQAKTEQEALEELLLCTKSKEEGGKGILYDRNLVEKFIALH